MFFLSLRVGWRSDKGLLRHLAYAVEAMVLASWCRQDQIDHIHAHFGTNPAAVAMFASMIADVPFSFTAHGSEEFEKAPLLYLEEKLKRCSFAVCVSSFGKSQLMRWSPFQLWGKIHVIHCGLDAQFFSELPSSIPDTNRFVCIGRLGEHKAQLILVRAIERLKKEGVLCRVVLVGDGPMRSRIEQLIAELGLRDQIQITGWASGDRVKEELRASRAMILPSFSENMPVVIMEAMALGRPVISTYIAGIPELVEPTVNGWLVPSSDEQALADAIRLALATDVQTLEKMAAQGRKKIEKHHDATVEAQKLVELFAS
jgi:glycosyltransferase involved in cell wall biosynthesis